MHEDEGDNRRMMLALLLCTAVVMVWPRIFPPPERPQPKAEAAKEEVRTATTAVAAVETSSVGNRSGQVVPDITTFGFEGSVTADDREIPFEVTLSNVGGAFEGYRLPSYREIAEEEDGKPNGVSLADNVRKASKSEFEFGQMAAISFEPGTTFVVPRRTVYEVAEQRDDFVRYRYQTGEGIVVEREYRFVPDSFKVELAVTIKNESQKMHRHQLSISAALASRKSMKAGGGFFGFLAPPRDHLEALCHAGNRLQRSNVQSLKAAKEFEGEVRWVAMDRQYFLGAIVARDDGTRAESECKLERKGDSARSKMILPPVEMGPGESYRHKFTAYLGVKVPSLLEAVEADLGGAVNYTIWGLDLAVLCEALLWVLRQIYILTGSWGLAIIGLTALVKIVLFPLSQRQGKSMRAMSALRPEMERIREKYEDDRQRQSEELMRLYKEHNVNPVGGCLPILLQLPIGLSLYRALWVSVDLYQEQFLWISDLTARDPYYILPVLLSLVMFLQQRMMPTAMDPAQQRIMMYTMPAVFGGLMLALPSGLCLYILVNTLLTIIQQHLINRSMGPPPGVGRPVVQGAAS